MMALYRVRWANRIACSEWDDRGRAFEFLRQVRATDGNKDARLFRVLRRVELVAKLKRLRAETAALRGPKQTGEKT